MAQAFQADAFYSGAFQAAAGVAAPAFQSNAFQTNAFQTEESTPITAFQSNAFQINAFQIYETPATGVVGVGSTRIDVLRMLGKGKRGKHYYRTGVKPDYDVNYRRWVETNPGVSRNPRRRRAA